MLKKLRIKNFKGWSDTNSISMAPITLLFGTNSSGKSSIGQFLMMLKQTAESQDRKAVLFSGGKNSAVQLGSFQEMVYHRNSAKKIIFEYEWTTAAAVKFKDPLNVEQQYSGDRIAFEAQVGISDKNQGVLEVDRFKYTLMQEEDQSLSVELHRSVDSRGYDVTADKYNLVRKKMRVWAPKNVVRFYGFPDEVVAYYQNAEFVQDFNLEQEKLFQSIYYLGPLRTKTERLYTWSGATPDSVGFYGENTISAILAARGRKISLGYKRPAKPFEEIIALKLKEMGLIDEFKVNVIAEQRQEYEVKVRTHGSTDWVDLPDVGFGISQVLPVLVQCFYAPPGSIIIMEQPEIHLHPSAQAALADVLLDVINSKENGEDRNIQLIIETHSEHFLRRLQRRIAEKSELEQKVAAYFANITKNPAVLEPLAIDEYGNIENWPENFFGDEMTDITEQSKAAMKKFKEQTAATRAGLAG